MKPLLLTLAILSLTVEQPACAADSGVRLFMTGNSFHMKTVPALADVISVAGIKDHTLVGTMLLGGSRAITLWEKPDAENPAKIALRSGKADTLTLCPWRQIPDPGVDQFVEFAVEHNANVRVTIQQIWMAFDSPKAANPHPKFKGPKSEEPPTPWDEQSAGSLRAIHAEYFAALDAQIAALNAKFGRPVIFCVPTGQACIALRELVRLGKAPGIKRQAELFTDELGHPGPVLVQLNAYCHFAVIYRRSPVGLAAPKAIQGVESSQVKPAAALLQQLAWDAVSGHRFSGVTATVKTR